jgi:hypothetical protein
MITEEEVNRIAAEVMNAEGLAAAKLFTDLTSTLEESDKTAVHKLTGVHLHQQIMIYVAEERQRRIIADHWC